MNDTTLDLRLTYICAHCKGLAEVSLWEIDLLDSGITLTCDKCEQQTVILLLKPSVYQYIVVDEASKCLEVYDESPS